MFVGPERFELSNLLLKRQLLYTFSYDPMKVVVYHRTRTCISNYMVRDFPIHPSRQPLVTSTSFELAITGVKTQRLDSLAYDAMFFLILHLLFCRNLSTLCV